MSTRGRLTRTPRRRQMALAVAALAVLVIAAFWPVLRNGFVGADDKTYITGNAVVREGLTLRGLVLAFSRPRAGNWHPLTWVSHMIDVECFGLDPRGHHMVGLALHAANAILLLALLARMTGRLGLSFVVAALFAVHPLRVESVAWAAERKDVLAGLFWMLTLAAHLRYARSPGVGRQVAVALLFACALMSKPMAVTLPVVLLILDWWPLGRIGSRPGQFLAALREKIPLLVLAAVASLVALRAQALGGGLVALERIPVAERVANALVAPLAYLGKAVIPARLAVYYPFVARRLVDPAVLSGALLLVAATVLALRQARRAPWFLAGWLWYLVTLLPVIGLVQVGGQAIADRYTYLPLIGAVLAIVAGCGPIARSRRGAAIALTAAAATAIAGCVLLTARQVGIWRDGETLYGHAAAVERDNWWAIHNLGRVREAAGDLDGAAERYRETLRIRPGFTSARLGLAVVLARQGKPEESRAELGAAVRSDPSDPAIRMELALRLDREGKADEAIGHLRELIRRSPRVAEAYNNLAALLARRGEVGEAASLLRMALTLNPEYQEARINLGLLGERP